ncbi:MAG: hypothetical protein ACMUIP_11285 [bacterium]
MLSAAGKADAKPGEPPMLAGRGSKQKQRGWWEMTQSNLDLV